MKSIGLFCLAILVAGSTIAGCGPTAASESDQAAKVKAMDDIAKKDTSHVGRPGERR